MFADGCTSAFWKWTDGLPIVGWDPGYGISIDTNLRCMPEAATAWWDQDWLGPNSETVTSLGPLTCPEPFKQVTTSFADASSTSVACCPPGYNFASWADQGTAMQCYSVVGSGTAITYHTRNNYKQWVATTLTTNTTKTVYGVHINGWVFAEETGSPESTAMASSTSLATDDGALSTGDKIGIGIGVGMGVAGLAALAVGLFMMRRAKRFHHPRHQQERQLQQQQTTQKDGPGWRSASAPPGAHRDSAAVGDRYVAPPSELYST
ncbi:hypothetical protein INS49_000876 [Diaporthe citri]|uniref:uncharacterized protein n=1 Tax=Diaporthe citri TaxID=83186 RepID=UPI001C7FABF6|nr:uncharacterized protein INS49_000876 [Diaporthe citri]KAG6366697.1 hypothetical protein INS49_000876 [Diaporthe citri]